MTATPAALHPAALRPVAWRGLGWVAWRRYRPALLTVAGLLGVVALDLIVRGLRMRHAYASLRACRPASSSACGFAFSQFQQTYGDVGPVGGLLVFVPGLLGMFVGAPLVAREFETGSFRYAWTQGVGRTRWLTALLVPGILGVTVVAAAFGALVDWYYQPLVDSGLQRRLTDGVFPITGIAVVGWALLAFSLGLATGTLFRRVVTALVATLAAWTALAFAASYLRQHDYLAPLVTRRLQLPAHDMTTGQWWTRDGSPVSQGQLDHLLQTVGAPTITGGHVEVNPGQPGIDPVDYLLHHGYVQWTSYQPDGRYWAFQSIEAAGLILLSLLLVTATLWLVRRRNA